MPMLTRRSLLLGAAASVLLVGCRDKTEPAPRGATVEELAREAAARAEQDLVDEYAIALVDHPSLTTRLTPLAEHHRRHIAALVRPPSPSPSPSTSPSASTARTAAQSLTRLGQLEHRLAGLHLAALPTASPDLGLLLASLAASASANAAALGHRA